jgi:hypothetical protein
MFTINFFGFGYKLKSTEHVTMIGERNTRHFIADSLLKHGWYFGSAIE